MFQSTFIEMGYVSHMPAVIWYLKDVQEVKGNVKEEPKSEKKEGPKNSKSKGEKLPISSSSGGEKCVSEGRWITRNSAMAVINKIKAGNIQLGSHPPVISYACLVVYSGPAGDGGINEIYKSNDANDRDFDVVSQVESADFAVSQLGVWYLNHLHIHTNDFKLLEGAASKPQ